MGCQETGSPSVFAVRTNDTLPTVGVPNGLKPLPQDNDPLPIHPCVIVDTRDPLDVTSDLLGNDVRIERIDSCVDLNKAWSALEPAQDCRSFTGSSADILGFRIAAQITPSTLFGENAQPILCSTVNVLPQRVRIIPNTSAKHQTHDGFPHQHNTPHCRPSGQPSQFVAEFNQVSSHRYSFECTPQNQDGFSLDFTNTTSRGNSIDLGKQDIDNCQFFSHSFTQPEVSVISCPSGSRTNSACWSETNLEAEHLVNVAGQIKTKNFGAKAKWGRRGLPEDEVRLWGAQILLALESLHEQGIVCQDLNPRNILLRSSGKSPVALLLYYKPRLFNCGLGRSSYHKDYPQP